MLKPRKKITRKEIKKDPVLERVANTYSFIQDKQKILVQIGIGIAIGFIREQALSFQPQELGSRPFAF